MGDATTEPVVLTPPRLDSTEIRDWPVSSVGVDFLLKGPNSVAAFDKNANRENACLEGAMDDAIFRGWLQHFRKKYLEAVTAETGIAREMVPDGDKTEEVDDPANPGQKIKRPVMKAALTEKKHLDMVYAKLGLEEAADIQNKFGALAQQVANSIAFDASSVEREAPTPAKTPQVYLNSAQSIIAAGKGSELAAKLTTLLVPAKPFEANVESLGKAIQLYEAAEAAKRRKAVSDSMLALASA